jgi:uncharacterized membrane protein YkvA (DUF1232 family)
VVTHVLLTAAGVAGGLVLLWLVLVGTLAVVYRRGPGRSLLGEALRLLPDLVRLLSRLARDPAVSRGVRIRLVVLVAYLASPVDLVPDVVPVLGYVDDALVAALGLRMVVRHAGPDLVERHWPGTPEGLRAVRRLAGTRPPGAGT